MLGTCVFLGGLFFSCLQLAPIRLRIANKPPPMSGNRIIYPSRQVLLPNPSPSSALQTSHRLYRDWTRVQSDHGPGRSKDSSKDVRWTGNYFNIPRYKHQRNVNEKGKGPQGKVCLLNKAHWLHILSSAYFLHRQQLQRLQNALACCLHSRKIPLLCGNSTWTCMWLWMHTLISVIDPSIV